MSVEKTIQAMIRLGVSFKDASKEVKRFIATIDKEFAEKIKRRERYLRHYRNRGKRMNQ